VVWGWFVSRSWVVWGGLVFWVYSFTGVSNVGNVSTISIRISGVSYGLYTTIGKVDGVGSRQGLAIGSFRGSEGGSRVAISYTVFESEWFWGFIIDWSLVVDGGMIWGWCRVVWGWVVWGRGSCWDGSSTSHEGRHDCKSIHYD
jgi:hypothetical protein